MDGFELEFKFVLVGLYDDFDTIFMLGTNEPTKLGSIKNHRPFPNVRACYIEAFLDPFSHLSKLSTHVRVLYSNTLSTTYSPPQGSAGRAEPFKFNGH